MYREIGLRDCFENGETFIYVNGTLAERGKGFTFIGPDTSTFAQIVLGASASGEQY
ncbi:MAG: hypothetical protein HN457_06285 [Opitutales bacterium]|nr:hypothetical protein [Opitutales bacterium]MDG2253684.1 hypothetical protein [Opitutaceae bacterium]MBT5166965.1 hypothetical protein [Opitutales bacterium]MBT5813725.1 hypothetical protein [Opitutales bacterium]MBT6381646.1 hypothetical protein [Opitutales bacterium]